MFIPIYDVNALRHIKLQYVTIGLIVLNVAIWLVTDLAGAKDFAAHAALSLGFIPALVHHKAALEPSLVLLPEQFTYVTYAFLHSNFTHLAGNMLFLWVFGDNVEDAMGHIRFLIFYLLCAAAGAFLHGYLLEASQAPLIGASGAISGVVAAYFFLHPKVRVWVLVLWRFPLPLPAFIPLLIWIGQQIYMLVIDRDANVSFAAHVGGIVAGLALTPLLKRRSAPLLDRRLVTPSAVELKAPESGDEQAQTPRFGRR